jgi:hypothetical protein
VDIRAQFFQKSFNVGFGEEHNVIHAAKRGNELRAGAFVKHGAAGSFEIAHAGIVIHADNQNVTFAARTFKITNVSDVESIKAAVGKDDATAVALVFRKSHAKHISRDDFESSLTHDL